MIDSSKLMNRKEGQTKFFFKANKKIISINTFLQRSLNDKRKKSAKKRNEEFIRKRKKQEDRLEDRKSDTDGGVKKFGGKLGQLTGATNLVNGFKNAIGKLLFGFFAIRLLKYLPVLKNILPLINGAANFISSIGIGLIDGFANIINIGYQAYDASKVFMKQIGGEDMEASFDKFMGAVTSVIDILLLATLIRASDSFGGPLKKPKGGGGGGFFFRRGRGPRKPKDPTDSKKPDPDKPKGGFPAGTALAGALAAALIFLATRGRVSIPASAALNAVRSSSALRELVKQAARRKKISARLSVDEVVSQVRRGQTARRRLAERTLGGVGKRRQASRAAAQRAAGRAAESAASSRRKLGEVLLEEMRSTAAAGGGTGGGGSPFRTPRDISKRTSGAAEQVRESLELMVGGGPTSGGGGGTSGGSSRSGAGASSGGQGRSKGGGAVSGGSSGSGRSGASRGQRRNKGGGTRSTGVEGFGPESSRPASPSSQKQKQFLEKTFGGSVTPEDLEKFIRGEQDAGRKVSQELINIAGDKAATRAGVLEPEKLISGKTGPKKLTAADVAPKKPRRVNKPVRMLGAPAPFPVIPSKPKAKISFFKRIFGFADNVFTKIPVIGPLVDFGINLAFGDPPAKAATKAIFATIFGAIGIAAGSVVPGAGTLIGGVLGGLAGDIIGGVLYDMVLNNILPPQLTGGLGDLPDPDAYNPYTDPELTSKALNLEQKQNVQRASDLRSAIRQGESGGNYSATYSGYLKGFPRAGEDLTKMTISQVIQYQKDYIDYQRSLGIPPNKRSAAVGAYQMLYPERAAAYVGIPLNAKFNKENQDKMLSYYLDMAGRKQYERGEISAEVYNDRLAGQFASLKTITGEGVYDYDGINKATKSVLDLIRKEYPDRSQGLNQETSYGEQASNTFFIQRRNLIQPLGQGESTQAPSIFLSASDSYDNKNILYEIG